MQQHSIFRSHADKALADADAATLDNVRDRCLRAAAAWTAMADRQERIEHGRDRSAAAVRAPEPQGEPVA